MSRRNRKFFFDNIRGKLIKNTTNTVADNANEGLKVADFASSEVLHSTDSFSDVDTKFLTAAATDDRIVVRTNELVDSAPETLNTLNELAAALGDDANYSTTTSTALGNRLRIDVNDQSLTSSQKSNAVTNLGLATVASSGAYSDLTGTPTIPTNNNALTNGAGYITGYTVTESDVTGHQAALSITESQISDLGSYLTGITSGQVTTALGYTPVQPSTTATLTSVNIVDTNTNVGEGGGNAVRITTDSGYVDVGAQNTSYCHIQTDRAKFYFNNRVDFDGDIYKYGTNTRLTDNNLYLEGASPTIYYRDTDHNVAMHHCNSNLMYTLRGATNTETWTQVSGQWPFIVNLSNNNCSVGGALTAVGNITAYSSDERLKENITPIPDALSKVMQLKGCTFDWKDIVDDLGFTPDQRTGDVGLIAQDMEKVLPALVVPAPFDMQTPDPDSEEDQSQVMKESKSGENYKTIQYEKVCALLIEAIKEQQQQIEELRGMLDASSNQWINKS